MPHPQTGKPQTPNSNKPTVLGFLILVSLYKSLQKVGSFGVKVELNMSPEKGRFFWEFAVELNRSP